MGHYVYDEYVEAYQINQISDFKNSPEEWLLI